MMEYRGILAIELRVKMANKNDCVIQISPASQSFAPFFNIVKIDCIVVMIGLQTHFYLVHTCPILSHFRTIAELFVFIHSIAGVNFLSSSQQQ